MDGRIMFALPATPLVKVTYHQQGMKYEVVLPNPRTNERLQEVLRARNVGIGQVRYIAAMHPKAERRGW